MKSIFTFLFIISSLLVFAQDAFTNLNGIPGGRIKSIQFDASGKAYIVNTFENKIYASTDTMWTQFGPANASINDLLIDGNDYYYADYASLYKSTNFGTSWTKISSNNSFRNTERLFKLPVGNVFVVYGGCEGVYVSSDGGVNWVNITGNTSCNSSSYQIAYDSNGNLYYVDETIGILRHPFPLDGVWSPSKVTTVFAKQTTGFDHELSVFVNRQSANKVFVTHTNSAETQQLIKTSATGNAGSFNALTAPVTSFNSPVWSVSATNKVYLFISGGFYELTNEVTPTWTAKAIPNGAYSDYNVLAFAWKSATEVYAGIDGSGVFRSTDAGATWTNFNGSGTNGLISPWGSDIELLGSTIVVKEDNGNKGVWTSADQGSSFAWRPQSFILYGGRPGQQMAKLQDNSIMMGSHNGTMRTTNGITWTQQNGLSYIIYLPVGSNEIVAIGDSNTAGSPVGRSTNLGVSWTNQSITGLPANWYPMYAVAASGNYFIALNNNTNGQTEYWKLTTSGSPWVATKLNVPISTSSYSSIGFFELNNKLVAGDQQKIAVSSDQGATWKVIQYPHEWVMPIRQGSGGIGLGTRGSLIITQDEGVSWRSVALPNEEAVVKDIVKDLTNNFYAVCQGGPVVKFTGNLVIPASELPPPLSFTWQPLGGPSGGQVRRLFKNSTDQIFAVSLEALLKNNTTTLSWDRITIPNHFYEFSDVIIDNANKIYALDNYQLLQSANGGTTWTLTSGGLNDARKIIKASNNNLVIATGDGLLLSTNDGSSFSKPSSATTGTFNAIGKISTGTLMAAKLDGGAASLIKSIDNGVTWTTVAGVDLSGTKEVLSISALETGAVAVVTTDNIYKSTDGGTNWTSIKGNLTATYNVNDEYWKYLSKVYMGPGNEYYLSNQMSLYSSTDNGASWTKKSDTPSSFHDLVFVSGKIYAATAIEGVYESADGGVTFAKYLNNKNLHGYFYNGLEIKNSKIFASSSYGKFFSSSDEGLTFSPENASNIYTDYVSKLNDGSLVAFGGGIAKSTDGINWIDMQSDPGYYISITNVSSDYYSLRDVNGTLQIAKSSDLKTWQAQAITNIPSAFNIESLAVDDANVYFTGYNFNSNAAELYRVVFGDAVRVDEVPNAGSVHYYNGKLFAYGRAGSIYESSNGTTWIKRSAPAGGEKLLITGNVYFFISNETTGDLWLSRDEGKSWQNVGGPEYRGDLFTKVRVDQATGIAYALAQNNPVLKSSTIVPDLKAPTQQALNPLPGSNTSGINFTVSLTFNEPILGVVGKKVRLVDVLNPATPLQIWDAPVGTLSNENKTVTFTPSASIGYEKNYFVIVDQGAFTDIFGNAFAGISSSTEWAFTTTVAPDAADPIIIFSMTDLSLTKGDSKQLDVTVTDDKNVPASTTFIHYRKIGANKSAEFAKQLMEEATTSVDLSKNFKITVLPAWYDDMGLEYYFETTDGVGKSVLKRANGDTNYYSYVKFGNESGTAKVSGIGLGRAESSYRIISVPHSMANAQIATQFDELGPADKASWRLLSYNSADAYDEYPNQLTSLTRGVGYWIISRDVRDVLLQDAEAPQNNRDELFTINLRQGWNLIGNPYTIAIDWAETKAGNAAVGDLNKFVNGIYSKVNTMGVFEGGFVFASQAVNGLQVQFPGGGSGGRIQQISADLAAEKWELPIMIYQGDRGNEVAGIGMNSLASEEIDRFDGYNPPSLLTAVELNFKTRNGRTIAKSIVENREEYAWEFTARSESEGSARLQWDNSFFGDNAKELYLLDLSNQVKVNMRLQSSYSFSGKARDFKIYFGESLETKIKPTMTILGDPFPNPSIGKVAIPFTVQEAPENTDIQIDIYNAMGQRIKSLTQNEYESGFHSIEWTNDQIVQGIFYCRMVSRSKSGSVARQTKKIIIQ